MRRKRIRAPPAARMGIPPAPRRFRPGAWRLWRARSSSVGSDPMLWVPNTTSTHGAFRRTVSRSFCARQPPTAICMSGSACLRGARWLRLPYSLLSAFSRTAQVLNTTTSASVPSAARWYPRLPATQPVVRSHAHSSGSRRCGPDRCAPTSARARRRQPTPGDPPNWPSPLASPSKSRPHGTDASAQRSEWIREFQASWTFPG